MKIKIEIKMLLFMTFLFMTREEVPRSTVTKMMELVRRQTAQQVELGVLEELWGEGSIFAARSISAATPTSICVEEVEGSSVDTSALLFYSSLIRPTFTFYSFLCLFLCLVSSVLDKGPCGLKVLAK